MEEIRHKDCYYCGEQILKVARKCKHCGEMLTIDNEQNNIHEENNTHEKNSRKCYPNFFHGFLSAITIGYWLPFWIIFYYHRDKSKYR